MGWCVMLVCCAKLYRPEVSELWLRCLWAFCALIFAFPLQADEHSSAAALLSGDQAVRLEQALSEYQAIEVVAVEAGWPTLPKGTKLSYGSRDSAVRTLRKRLRLTGDYSAEMGADPLLFDAALQSALVSFQIRHGLHSDGVVRGQTLEMLNLPPETRSAQLKHALRSWTDLQAANTRSHSGPRVWVNIPEATVTAIADNEIVLHMRAVVGHPTRPTPALSSAITRIIVNPPWTVPVSIAGTDLLPRQISNPDYLPDNGFHVFAGWQENSEELDPAKVNWKAVDSSHFPYRLRQDPGPKNSLGRFKFDFPNPHDVYLHDTPVQALLGLSVRSLSSGCVRIQDPASLADWLVDANAANREGLLEAAADPNYRTRAIKLSQPVPVDMVYLTAWVSESGQVNFRRDVYQMSLPATQRDLLTAAQ